MVPFIYKTYNEVVGPYVFGEQIMLKHLLKSYIVEVEDFSNLGDERGAIIAIRACDNLKFIDRFNDDISKLRWCVVLVLGNENHNDFFSQIQHQNVSVWLQTPGIIDKADGYLPIGYPSIIEHIPRINEYWACEYDVFFAGQVTHERRIQCVAAAERLTNYDVSIVKSSQFGGGIDHDEYIKRMRSSRIVLCPGGPVTPDTFRIYEVLECGAVPIIDTYAGDGYGGELFWKKVLGDFPFPIVTNWGDIEQVVDNVLCVYDVIQERVAAWWLEYKRNLISRILRDTYILQQSI